MFNIEVGQDFMLTKKFEGKIWYNSKQNCDKIPIKLTHLSNINNYSYINQSLVCHLNPDGGTVSPQEKHFNFNQNFSHIKFF